MKVKVKVGELSDEGKKKFKQILAALCDGRVTLAATCNGELMIIPASLFKGTWVLNRVNRARPYVSATNKDGTEVGPRYYDPVFGPPLH